MIPVSSQFIVAIQKHLAIVYSTGEYCASLWCRNTHTHLADTSINQALSVSNLREQPFHPCRHPAPWACLVSRAVEPNHLLHQWLTKPPRRLKSRRPFVPAPKELLLQCKDLNTGAQSGAQPFQKSDLITFSSIIESRNFES